MSGKSVALFQTACVCCGVAVALGAFGAHGLKDRLSPDLLVIFEVGVRYQFYHGLALLALSLGGERLWASPWTGRAAMAWLAGIAVFSGSLYLLALTGVRQLGAITPIGGVAFLLGWIFAILGARSLRAADA